jgi:hypothetical protein
MNECYKAADGYGSQRTMLGTLVGSSEGVTVGDKEGKSVGSFVGT